MYNIEVIVHLNNANNVYSFGNNSSSQKLMLLFDGNLDSGHYDILEYSNDNVKSKIVNLKDNTCKISDSQTNTNLCNQNAINHNVQTMNNSIKVKIIGDGNCLFRCFSYFLYNNQNLHYKVRLNVVKYITNNWNTYQNFILGNQYYKNIINGNDYELLMSQNGIYGNEIEIKAFAEMYNIQVSVHSNNANDIYSFGNNSSSQKLMLLFDGNFDSGHYDIFEYFNDSVKSEILQLKKNNRKRKIDSQTDTKIRNKKSKLIVDYNRQKNKRTKKKELNCSSYLGEMNYKCRYCSAVFWNEEQKKSNCCQNGNIILSPLSNYDAKLKHLLLNDDIFRYLIRYYNNLFGFATFNANIKYEKKKAIYNLKIQGQICHTTPNTLIPVNNKEPCCGQLYIYDNVTAVEKRLSKNKNLSREHLKLLTEVLNKNPYAKKYKHLHEVANENMSNYKMYFIRKNDNQQHRYNAPLTSECGAIIVSQDQIPENYDICIYPKHVSNNHEITYLNKLSHHVDPMVFPLLFPSGDLGWSIGYLKKPNVTENLTTLQYYLYRLAYRPNCKIFNPLLYSGRLTQQFFLHAYIIVENNRMNYFRSDQKNLRVECYQGLLDHVMNSAANISSNFKSKEKLGNLFILPATYIGSPRYMQQHYQDAMAIMRNTGRPDLFITVTCNPKWKELKEILKNFPRNTTPNDIPNITVRLFHTKLKLLIDDIYERYIFGNVISYIYTIEFQKRGLPHAHILVTLNPKNKLLSPEKIDKYISAEIPSKKDDEELHKLVIKHMLHGPHNNHSPCYVENKPICKKNFPKPFTDSTTFQKNGYPQYRRKNNVSENLTYKIRNNQNPVPVNNSMVVPYNSFLLKKYQCHINVEYCASIQSIKYIFNYIHKGCDKAFCKLKKINTDNEKDVHDEITQFIDGRYLSPMEAAWRLQEFPLCGRSHTVVRLAVHTENKQNIIFEENNEEKALDKWKTTLTSWFELNKNDDNAKNIKYVNIPKYYIFKNKSWIERQRKLKHFAIGRLNVVSPKDSERFHLKLILNRVKGATSFKELRTFENKTYNTYKETAIQMGLVENDLQIEKIFEEACSIMLPVQLRKFFSWFLITDNINGNTIWTKFNKYFTEDFNNNKDNRALQHINEILKNEEMSCKDFGLPEPDEILDINNENNEENTLFCKQMFNNFFKQLNEDQKIIFTHILNNEHKIFFIDGPGGSGKTFLYKTLIYYFLSVEKKVLSMAWTGIASILLPKGMTSHKTFRLPLDLNNIESAFLKFESDKKKFREVTAIIWDEASMIPRKALEIVDKTLQDVCNNNLPFGGKLLVLGGDFRQILPVVKNGCRSTIIQETIKYSNLWSLFYIMYLKKNIRSKDNTFASFLLDIGEGKFTSFVIPDNFKTNDVCFKIYEHINYNVSINSVILTSHNEDANILNNKILRILSTEAKTYYSLDYATHKDVDLSDEDIHINYPIEALNNIREGLPPHKLKLKVNSIVMLIRNLSITDGLCNGTRLKITKLFKYNIEAEIITGEKCGNKVFIPRITLNTGNSSSLPFVLYRKQFPLILAFTMTINKSQGQSFDSVGIYIRRPLFSHGQLYVALSRCRNADKIFIENNSENKEEIINIVWKEIFDN